jgi:NTE family protein
LITGSALPKVKKNKDSPGKLGLVLAGGGGKGAYHIGVWKALKEFGVDEQINYISGTSVGALNAALFAYGDYELAEQIWLNISPDKFMTPNVADVFASLAAAGLSFVKPLFIAALCKTGICSRQGLLDIINNNLDLNRFMNSRKTVYAGAFNLTRMEMEYLPITGTTPEKVKKSLLASSAIPVVYAPVNIDGNYYIDGGVVDNVPVEPLCADGCTIILAVHLSRDCIVNAPKDYGCTKIIEIVPVSDLGDKVDGTFDFTSEGAERRLAQGYNDTVRILKPLFEMGLVQHKIQQTLENIQRDEILFKAEHAKNLEQIKKIDSEYLKLQDDMDALKKR